MRRRPLRKKLWFFGLALLVTAGAGIFLWQNFEIYPTRERLWPSREAMDNPFLALERWLAATGHPAQARNSGNIRALKESAAKVAVVHAAAFQFSPGPLGSRSWDELRVWVEKGGALTLVLDFSGPAEEPAGLRGFLALAGLRRYYPESGTGAGSPDFSSRIAFKPIKGHPNRPRLSFRRDSGGLIRSAEISLGRGRLTLLGYPVCMHSNKLEKESNARLAWELTGGRDAERRGVLFIREMENGGSVMAGIERRGKPFFLVVSGAVLAALGFWAAAPVFGRPQKDNGKPGRPLRERFLVEGRFLKKFGGLETYLDAYKKEIHLKFRRREGGRGEAAFAARLSQITGLSLKTVESAFAPGRGFRDFLRRAETLKTILERIR